MSKEEYLSITEFAERAGVSKQAVYKRLKTTLTPYVSTVEGRKMLSIEGLKEFEYSTVEQPLNPKQSTIQPVVSTVETLRETIKLLEKQLETKDEQIKGYNDQLKAKDEQIRAKDEQIKGYSENLANAMRQIDAAHALHAGTIQHDLITAPAQQSTTDQRAEMIIDGAEAEPQKSQVNTTGTEGTGSKIKSLFGKWFK